MGCPYGWGDDVHNLPITRISHLSTPLGIPFSGKHLMLGDVETHPGMSGSPVFMDLNDYITMQPDGQRIRNIGSQKTILVGIHFGRPRVGTSTTEEIDHSLIEIWFADLILEILGSAGL